MKKLFAFVAVFGMLLIGASLNSYAQEGQTETPALEQVAQTQPAAQAALQQDAEGGQLHKEIKRLFIEGGAQFMGVVLLCLIFGLAIAIERIIYLNLATTNTNKLLANIEAALKRVESKQLKKFAVIHADRLPVSSIRDLTELTKV
jgi:biopolymer transport protein ExbB